MGSQEGVHGALGDIALSNSSPGLSESFFPGTSQSRTHHAPMNQTICRGRPPEISKVIIPPIAIQELERMRLSQRPVYWREGNQEFSEKLVRSSTNANGSGSGLHLAL